MAKKVIRLNENDIENIVKKIIITETKQKRVNEGFLSTTIVSYVTAKLLIFIARLIKIKYQLKDKSLRVLGSDNKEDLSKYKSILQQIINKLLKHKGKNIHFEKLRDGVFLIKLTDDNIKINLIDKEIIIDDVALSLTDNEVNGLFKIIEDGGFNKDLSYFR